MATNFANRDLDHPAFVPAMTEALNHEDIKTKKPLVLSLHPSQLDFSCDFLGGFSRNFCLFGKAGPVGHGPLYVRQNLLSVLYAMLFAQYLKLSNARILPLAHDEHTLLAAWAIG